ncbi:hypothetical protein NMY22_g18852 [Coprinellus aureogranulatus]|nr:hypothetical protein NMY22_g18852 [Coprinellus aureogranulatus]
MYHEKNILRHLPTWASRWLGYRPPHAPTLPPPQGQPIPVGAKPPSQPVVWIWSWIGAFCGISVIQAVFGHAQYFVDRGVTPIVPSYGATAVLVYGVIDSPLAQPRNVFVGHFIGSLVGVCITKLFLLLPTQERFDELAWLAASLACATAIVLMQMTKTVHPPAGATAFLPILDPSQRALGWYFIPVILLSSVLALAVALVINNVQRRYPMYWIDPPAPPAKLELRAAEMDGGMGQVRSRGSRMEEKELQGGISEKALVGSSAQSVRVSSTPGDTTGRTTPDALVMEVER